VCNNLQHPGDMGAAGSVTDTLDAPDEIGYNDAKLYRN